MLQKFGWSNWTEAHSTAADGSPSPTKIWPQVFLCIYFFFCLLGLWGALAVWVSTSVLLEPTWQVSNIPRWWSSGHVTDTHPTTLLISFIMQKLLLCLFVVFGLLPNPCKFSSGFLFCLLNGKTPEPQMRSCSVETTVESFLLQYAVFVQ